MTEATAVPTPDAQPANEEHTAVIARQEILDRQRAVFGYELFDRTKVDGDFTSASDASLLFSVLSHAGTESLFGRKTLFLNVTHATLSGSHLELIQPEQVVLEVPPVDNNDPAIIDVVARKMTELRERGFRMAFKHTVLTKPYASWLPLASFIKMEMTEVSESTVEPLLRLAQKVSKAKVVAEKVETAEQYERLQAMGVELFQGYWFTRPTMVHARLVAPAQAIIIQLINLVRKEADPVEIETLLKRDPTLSFNLLRFINSSGFGLSVEITSFRHAVMILGLRKLFRWAAMLLTASRAGGSPPAVGNMAVLRGRLMELLAAEMLPAEEWDNAFVVGVFSLLDVMLGMPIEKALETIALPQHVVDALVHRTGIFAPFLRIVEVCESGTDAEVAEAAEALALTNRQVNMAHLEAMAWTENLLASNG